MALLTRNLRECCEQDGLTADAAEPVFRNVKVCGLESVNGRVYTEQALLDAVDRSRGGVPVYEGQKVNIDHPKGNPNETRSLRDRFGFLENIRFVPGDGVRGDLRYNPKHAEADAFRWWAENAPHCLGLSHNAVGQGKTKDGVFVVEKIVSVRSVDLVADPATTKGLTESVQPMKLTLKRFFESAKWEAKNAARIQRRIAKLMEDGDMMADAPMPDDAAEGPDHEQALKDGFRAACVAVLDDDTMDAEAKCKRLRKLLMAHDKLSADGGADDDEEEESEGDDEKDDDEEECYGKKMESVDLARIAKKNKAVADLVESDRRKTVELDGYKAKEKLDAARTKAATLCESLLLPKALRTDVFLDTLAEAGDEKKMKALIEDRRRLAGVGPARSSAPGQAGGGASDEQYKAAVKGR